MTDFLWHGEDAARSVRGEGRTDWQASGVSIDSRTLERGDLFIALQAEHDGHAYVGDAMRRGAAAAIVSRVPEGVPPDTKLVLVPDTFAALQDLGSRGRARARGKIIAVTGSVGKTGSKEQLRHMLAGCGAVYASQGSFNNHWGVPLSLSRLPQDAAWGVFELGMNHAGEIAPLARQVQPHVALITTVEAVHLEHFTGVEAIADAKAEIFLGMDAKGTAALNRDNPHFSRLAAHARTQGLQTILSFGHSSGADARMIEYRIAGEGGDIRAEFFGKPLAYRISAPGLHYAMNSLGALLTAQAAGAPLEACAAALASYTPPEGRGARHEIALPDGGSITLIDESYNASPVAMRAAIAVLGQSAPGGGGRRIAILGDMRELGQTAPRLHAELAEPLIAAKIDQVYCCGHMIQGLLASVPSSMRGRYAADSKSLAAMVAPELRGGDVVLVKGSKSVHMEAVIEAIRALNAAPAAPGNGRANPTPKVS
ncbi:MAG: UDP-N-acetylmuramoyl-tripeptide--D-alanyl-D-alanine ligase [Alphaproteobacteria bacterium]